MWMNSGLMEEVAKKCKSGLFGPSWLQKEVSFCCSSPYNLPVSSSLMCSVSGGRTMATMLTTLQEQGWEIQEQDENSLHCSVQPSRLAKSTSQNVEAVSVKLHHACFITSTSSE